jgi:alkylation response protein AidB-like acyl-CoA dehydrogenase
MCASAAFAGALAAASAPTRIVRPCRIQPDILTAGLVVVPTGGDITTLQHMLCLTRMRLGAALRGASRCALAAHLHVLSLQVQSADQHSAGHHRAAVHHSLLQVALDLCKQLAVDDAAQHPDRVGAVQVHLAVHVLQCWAQQQGKISWSAT